MESDFIIVNPCQHTVIIRFQNILVFPGCHLIFSSINLRFFLTHFLYLILANYRDCKKESGA